MMKYKKLKAFTMAELMILLLILSILLAAFSPVFTTRFTNYSSDNVWSYISADDEYDAYYDTTGTTLTAQAFIGITPTGAGEVAAASQDEAANTLYSKLVIRASDRINAGNGVQMQKQMHFRYGSSDAGDFAGALFAGNGNFLLGGTYNSITSTAEGNTAYGYCSLNDLTKGTGNTAVGGGALQALTTGNYNTAVGHIAGHKMTTGTGNISIGQGAAYSNTSGNYNTFIGYQSGYNASSIGNYNTFAGNYTATQKTASSVSYNTGIGNYALKKVSSGSYNTAVGYNALSNATTGSYNTAVGINACTKVETGDKKTCIGAYSGSTTDYKDIKVDVESNLFTGTQERIFIGGAPQQYKSGVSSSEYPGAVLEVHNVANSNDTAPYTKKPIGNAADASVVINGNLIVRGQTYLETPIRRYGNTILNTNTSALESTATDKMPKGLTAYATIADKGNFYLFAGKDGSDKVARSKAYCNGCRDHVYDDIRRHCICTTVSSSSSAVSTKYTDNKDPYPLSSSYDWSTEAIAAFSDSCRNENDFGSGYTDGSYGAAVTFSDCAGTGSSGGDCDGLNESDDPMSHRKNRSSCCPVLLKSSDRRLKNIGEKFNAGLAQLNKINIYNYTFKDDADKTPYVGVIAQDLRTVFPDAVKKAAGGYLQIRWDEMFYALVNAVKEVSAKVTNLALRITGSQERITELKKDNAALNAQLDKLADEITALEAEKK